MTGDYTNIVPDFNFDKVMFPISGTTLARVNDWVLVRENWGEITYYHLHTYGIFEDDPYIAIDETCWKCKDTVPEAFQFLKLVEKL